MCAGIFQLATPIFFFMGRICQSHTCSVGPGTALSAVTALAWIIFGAELYHHCPITDGDHNNNSRIAVYSDDKTPRRSNTTTDTSDYLMRDDRLASSISPQIGLSQLEMSDFTYSSQQYFNRFNHQQRRQYNPPDLS
jgi:hypothetical protein